MKSILLVDDEPMITAMGALLFENLGYNTTATDSGFEALDLFRIRPDAFDLVVTDYIMPGMKGNELALEIHGIRPDIPVILCTGSTEISCDFLRKWGLHALMTKPYKVNEVVTLVRGVLG